MVQIKHTRTEITITTLKPVCPYCKKEPIRKTATCGNFSCQWKHHIISMRKNRKTERTVPSIRIKI